MDAAMLPIYSHFKLLPLCKMISLEQANFMFRYHNDTLPLAFDTYCERPLHNHYTRFSKTNFRLPSVHSKTSDKSIKVIGPKIWSEIDPDIKALPFRKTFSRYLKNHFISELPVATTTTRKKSKINANSADLSWSEIFESDDNDESFIGF